MKPSIRTSQLAIAMLCMALAGCASPDPVAYSGLQSSPHLAPNPHDDSGRIPYSYSAPAEWRSYSKAIIDPVVIYGGADHQFGDMADKDKAELARYMQDRFAKKMRTRFSLVREPGPNTLRLRLTLTGAAANKAFVSTFSHLDLAGNLYNGVQAVRGREGMISGAVIYAVEISDASTGRLLDAYVTKQYPGAMNIGASMGSLAAAETGIDKGADLLIAQLQ